MTSRERAIILFENLQFAVDGEVTDVCERAINAAVAEAVQTERERCAKLCESNDRIISGSIGPLMDVGWGMCARNCAAAIRSPDPSTRGGE